MCGIVGIFHRDPEETVSRDLLDRMLDALAHRGPDGRGSVALGPAALGARRLAIVDVDGGAQPITSDDGAVHLVYNGETYNHAELRSQLEGYGHRFRTRCDTEVVLHGFRQWGIRGLVERMNGIFAFALWDAHRRQGYLARDRLGVKPLYYVDRNGRFVFASELRALALCGLLRPRVDDVALWAHLTYQFSPDERTLLAGARKLPAAHTLAWRDGAMELSRYWDLPAGGEVGGDFPGHAEEVRALLRDSVSRQMMSDGPVGSFLSGGLDSSLVASLMDGAGARPLRTYSISFPDHADCDESAHFESVARALGSVHQTVPFTAGDVLSRLDRFAWATDEPVGDPAMFPTWVLAETAARDVKVVLTGEGADEIFAGYPYYREFVHGAPSAAGEPDATDSWRRLTAELGHRLRYMFPAPRNDRRSPLSGFPYVLDAGFLWHLLASPRRPPSDRLESFAERLETRALDGRHDLSPLQRAQALDLKLWLANDLLPKLDKATMAHSLEGRVPLLDHRLVELAFSLPGDEKVGAEHGKRVLREAARGSLPASVLGRRKQGFNVPLADWFRGPLMELLRETVLGTAFTSLELFDRRALEALVVAHCELGRNFARPLWQILCAGLWWRQLRESMLPFDPIEKFELAAPAGRAPATNRGPRSDSVPLCDVVVPVYEGVNYVRDLLRSLARSTEPGLCRVFLLDDSASDETHAALRALLADHPSVSLLRNEANLGFLATANRGIACGSAPYVCLLNSDTLVSNGWLERLLAAAESDPAIAVVNPVSNKAVNLSVPMPPGYDLNSINRKLHDVARRNYPDITTAVGFCMLVKRRYLEWLGGFDPIYGHGYCEESDLCMRFTEAGLRVVLADDAFVYHKGCGSFGTWLQRYRANRPIFDARWADEFERDYSRFLARNPIQPLRDSLLRNTIGKYEWSAVVARVLDAELTRQRIQRVSRIALHPARAAQRLWSAAGDARRRATDWMKATARPRTAIDPEQRVARYPTRVYIADMPRAENLRITFLVADMPVCGGIISITQLAREFILRGHDVRIVTTSEELAPERFNLPAQPLVFPDRETLLRCFPPSDVVIATFWTTAHDYLEELGRRGHALSIYYVQDYEAYFYPEGDIETRNRVMASYGLAERRIVKSHWLRDLIESRHGQPCEIVPLGLDLGIFRRRAASPGRLGRPRIVSVARPRDRRRGFAELVAAFRSIHQCRPDIELVCIGTPTEAMPADLGFPYLGLGNLADQNDVAALLSSCDVLIDPSLFQAFGRPGLEAMACGTNCVLTSEGGISEYARHEENCLLVRPGDPRGLADAALRLLGDPVLRDRLRHAGMATAQRFSHVAEAERHLDLYRGWLAERTCRTVPSSSEPSLALRRAAGARGASARPAPEPIV